MTKYKAIPTEIDGIRFASKLEARRYEQLKLLEKLKKITALELQPRFPLTVDGKKICTYVADFRYWDREKQISVIEDCKGFRTKEYILKKKLFQAITGLTITEITHGR